MGLAIKLLLTILSFSKMTQNHSTNTMKRHTPTECLLTEFLLLSVPCQAILVTVEACNISGLKTTVEVDESDTVQSLKTEIYKIDGFKEYDPELRLFFRKDTDHTISAYRLRDELTLSNYGIGHGSTIFM